MKVIEAIKDFPYLLKGIGVKNIVKAVVVFAFANYVVHCVGAIPIVIMAFVLMRLFSKD